MRAASLAAVAFTLLIAPRILPGQTSGGSQQQLVPPKQAPAPETPGGSALAPSRPTRPRTPQEDEELRGDILMARKDYAEAAAVYQKLVGQDPRNAIMLNKVGIAYHQQTMLDQAKRYYERAARADRTYANAFNNIGTIYYQRKNYRKAVRSYKKALAIRPDMAAVHSNLGYAYFAQKRYDDAMLAFHRALELDPGVFERSQHVGSLLQDRSVDDRGLFYFFLAKSFASMGNAERCAHYLRKARDEGYRSMAAVQSDPAFAGVLHDPAVQELLQPSLSPDSKPPAVPPSPSA